MLASLCSRFFGLDFFNERVFLISFFLECLMATVLPFGFAFFSMTAQFCAIDAVITLFSWCFTFGVERLLAIDRLVPFPTKKAHNEQITKRRPKIYFVRCNRQCFVLIAPPRTNGTDVMGHLWNEYEPTMKISKRINK